MNTGAPLVSVLMVTYNAAPFIRESIESVLHQSCDDFELIISDDNSPDGSWDIITEYVDNKRVFAYKQIPNLGEYRNRNFCIEKARGKFLLYIDGEDLLYYHAIETLVYHIKKYPHVAMIVAREWDERIIYPKVLAPRDFLLFEYLDQGIAALNFTRLALSREIMLKHDCFDDLRIRGGDAYIQYKLGAQYDTLVIAAGFSWWRRRRGQASEILLQDSFNIFSDDNKFKVKILEETTHLLPAEKKIAYENYYGNILRYIIKSLLKFKLAKTVEFISNHPIPFRHFKSIVTRQRRSHYQNYNGENPLKE